MDRLYVKQRARVKVNLEPYKLDANYEKRLEQKIVQKYGNNCYMNGYIRRDGIKILSIENGRREGSHLHGFLTFYVEFSAFFYIPVKGNIITFRVAQINKFGAVAKSYRAEIIVPRQIQCFEDQDLEKFANLKPGDSIRVKTLDYDIHHDHLIIIGIIVDFEPDPSVMVDLQLDALAGSDYQIDQTPITQTILKPKLRPEIETIKANIDANRVLWETTIAPLIDSYQLINPHSELINFDQIITTTIYQTKTIFPILSHDYFPLREILITTGLIDNEIQNPLQITILTEETGGLLQSLIDYRNQQHNILWTKDEYHAMTYSPQGWKIQNYLKMTDQKSVSLQQSDHFSEAVITQFGEHPSDLVII